MAKLQVSVGHNVRAWTTFTVADATPEEAAILGDIGSVRAVKLLAKLFDEKRAVPDEVNTQYETGEVYFDEAAEADVVDIEEED